MNRTAFRLALGAAALAVATCASIAGAQGDFNLEREARGLNIRPLANPGEVVATELAFARMAKDKGQWTAFAEYAAKDAVMFAPGPVRAQQWLKGRANPARAVAWEPYQVWSSCDGSIAVTKGPWTQPDGSVGYFTTVWQRQEKGDYKWVMDQGDQLAEPLAEPDMVEAAIADCPNGAPDGPPRDKDGKPLKRGRFQVAAMAADGLSGSSVDRTLSWQVALAPGNGRALRVSVRRGERMEEVLTSIVAAPPA
jgi:hypothetical protein